MKRFLKIGGVVVIVLLAVGAWILLGSGTGFTSPKEYLYIRSDAATKEAVLDSLQKNKIVSSTSAFSFLAGRMNYWDDIRPGRYEIKKGTSLLSIVRMLRNGQQKPVDLVITKFRTKEDFARFTGARFEFDSLDMISFLNSNDSLKKFDVDSSTVFCNILPDSYQYLWNSSPAFVYQKLFNESKKFWDDERTKKAAALGLSTDQVYTLASIIEEETTNHKEKDTVASVYLNRLKVNMPLQADPTLKFAARSFALKRIAGDILRIESPYNTYQRKGLPPGPICTPSKITIDAVLNAANTDYLYFVANSRLNGHLFSSDFKEHVAKANAYRQEDKLRRQRDSLRRIGQ